MSAIWLASVKLACQRVAVRSLQGGPSVSAEVVERRYWRGLRNFVSTYRALADTWTLCDNSSSQLVFIARGAAGKPETVLHAAIYDRIKSAWQ